MPAEAPSSPPAGRRLDPRSLVNPATIILIIAVGLALLGLTILFSASAWLRTGPYFYLNKQVFGVLLAAGVCFVMSRVNLDYARRYAWWVFGICAVLLFLTLVVGIRVNGSRRWLGFGSLRVQVSEFAKLGLVFCLAHYLALNQTRIGELRRGFVYPLGIIGVIAVLTLLEPDFGVAALMVAVGLVLLFLAGAKWRFILPTVLLVGSLFSVAVIHNPNRLRRMTEFLSEDKSYQLRQGLAAFAAGGVEGAGLGNGRQQLSYLPEAHTDYIFSVVGEELGVFFTLGVVAAFGVILAAGLVHVRRAPSLFHYLLVVGCVLLISLQAIINIGVVTAVFPTKGMSLPFISAGLSNLLLMGMLLGIILNSQRNWGRAALPRGSGAMREVHA
ncbi:MAG: putative lipid II flippase FtsW [Opitutaceae bacterium]|nr:putative lipid II flippase FtsW [Opitutaceae bacterium]